MTFLLCGLPCCGKTTVGKLLATHLHRRFIDTDQLIETAFPGSLSCREIFLQLGEQKFRALEKAQIASLIGQRPCIISLGGGCCDAEETIQVLQQLGTVIYLKVSPTTLYPRMVQRGIPPYLDPQDPRNSFLELAMKRMARYEKAASIIIDTSTLSAEATVVHILQRT